MAGWQQTIIVGNVGKDPEMKYFQDGTAVCNFSVAVNRKSTNPNTNEVKDETTWFRVACWRRQAEIANQYVRKGTQIMVVGRVTVRAYMGPDNQPQASLELTADNFTLLGSRGDNAGGQQDQYGGQYGGAPQNDSEIPF